MNDYSFITNAHPGYIEGLYKTYQNDPEAIEKGWRTFFEGFDYANGHQNGQTHSETDSSQLLLKEYWVIQLIYAYRLRGHLLSTTNPIRPRKDRYPHLSLTDHKLDETDLGKKFAAGMVIGLPNATLAEIIDKLKQIYCGNIGFEYAHLESLEKRRWLKEKIENRNLGADYGLTIEKKKRILEKLTDAVVFERFLHTKYVGQKRFSLEGGETSIAGLDAIINKCQEGEVEEVVIGMAHRGRLNVLANVMGKTYEQIFSEFEGTAVPDMSFGDGDVKYHLGFSSQIKTSGDKVINLKLVPNPSHLEAVNPVVEGFARAKANLVYKSNYNKVLPILIHGDAAVAGQGIVYETIQMSQLPGYHTGGTIHFVINNQVGFTTDYDDARSSTYCTGVAAIVQAPVFHVNGDDPEAVIFASELATEYRLKFNGDVFIDMVCYRRHGHNEGDDPKFTQPQMYELINGHKDARELYSNRLAERGDLEAAMSTSLEKEFWDKLQARLDRIKQKALPYSYQEPELAWKKLKKTSDPKDFEKSPVSGIDTGTFDKVIKHLQTIPEGFVPLDKVKRLLQGKEKLIKEGVLDWGYAELLAYASILMEGKDVRMSGQDVIRGTFSHRHAIFYDSHTYLPYNRLDNLGTNGSKFRIFNSLLSEFAVLGFEYGYSLSSPDHLVLWEAQFGDFYNGAQTMVDQFIMAGESKWQRMSGLVMLLPHGYDGQGAEHSSARLERFLQQCADFNVTIANVTTPANFFHLLRRQLIRPFRKPLVVMSPKSLLRHPLCISPFKDFIGKTSFNEVIDDKYTSATAKKVRKLLLCSGQIYYDLIQRKESLKASDIALVRIEQLYPFPDKQVNGIIEKYENAERIWIQEEPANMGAWQFICTNFPELGLKLISRKASSAPATGFKKVHEAQLEALLTKAFE